MRRRMLPLVRLVGSTAVALTVVALAGCGLGAAPAPTATATASASPTTTTPVVVPTQQPTTVDALPGSAFLRVSATAEVGDEEVRLELTFARAQTGIGSAAADFAAVQQKCVNAITSQLEVNPGLEPTGVIISELSMVGDWPQGMAVAVVAGGSVASFGEGTNVAPTEDAVGAFGCTVPVVTGPGAAEFVSLLLGDPAVADRTDLEKQISLGYFGFETDADSAVDIRWRDCVIQLSSAAQRIATASGWLQQTQGNFGCLIGDTGSV